MNILTIAYIAMVVIALHRWEKKYAKSLNAAQDLDKQVSDCRYVIAENNIRIAMLEREVGSCNDIIDDADADIAMLNINITEMFMENQALQRELNGYYKELALIKANHTLTPICHKCKRRMKKESLLVDGTYTCDWCKQKKEKSVKPLLADAKVGDLCKRRDGKWVQIDSNICMIGLQEENYEKQHRACRYLYNGSTIYVSFDGTCLYNHPDFDIISTEPLATEGSKEWVKQMLLLGHKITNIDWIEDYSSYHTEYAYLDGDTVKFDSMSKGLSHSITDFLFYGTKKFGWKLYSEPKQAPDPTLIKEPSDIDLSNLPDIFDAETAGRVIEAGGYVSWGKCSYYALSTKNDGSVGCFPINKAPFADWCYTSVQKFVETLAGISFTKATPDFLKGDKK